MAGGRTDRPREHGWVSVDLHDAGALLQDPVGQQARLLNARHLTDPAGLSTTRALARSSSTAGRGSAPGAVVMEPANTPQRTTTSSHPPPSRRLAAMRCGQASSGRTRSARAAPRSRQRRRSVQVPASS